MLGVGASTSIAPGHHAPAPAVLFSRAYLGPWSNLHELEAVICESGIGVGPFTRGISEVHASALCQWKSKCNRRIWKIISAKFPLCLMLTI